MDFRRNCSFGDLFYQILSDLIIRGTVALKATDVSSKIRISGSDILNIWI